jgi:hypothetical protein
MSDGELENWKNIRCILDVAPMTPEWIVLENYTKLKSGSITTTRTKKLVPNLNNKRNYIIHHRNLKYYISKGLKITKNHRWIKFEEQEVFKDYIKLNTRLRKAATISAFEISETTPNWLLILTCSSRI